MTTSLANMPTTRRCCGEMLRSCEPPIWVRLSVEQRVHPVRSRNELRNVAEPSTGIVGKTSRIAVSKTASRLFPIAALLVAMISVQYGATYAKRLFPLIGAEGTTAARLVVGALLLTIAMRAWKTKVAPHAVPALVGYGVALAGLNLLFFLSLRTIPLGIAVALEFSGPLLVATLTTRRLLDFAWIALALLGLLLLTPLVHSQSHLDPAGAFLALGAGACWALYIVIGRKAGQYLGTQATAFGMMIAAALVLPLGIFHTRTSLFNPTIVLAAFVVGIFSSALPFTLEMAALTRIPARTYGIVISGEPAVAALMGFLFLHEVLSSGAWLGIAVVVVAALGASMTTRDPQPSKTDENVKSALVNRDGRL